MKTLYEVLGVAEDATKDEIKKAYRSLSKIHHPDVNGNGNNDEFNAIQEAYSVLSDDVMRAEYDHTGVSPGANPVDPDTVIQQLAQEKLAFLTNQYIEQAMSDASFTTKDFLEDFRSLTQQAIDQMYGQKVEAKSRIKKLKLTSKKIKKTKNKQTNVIREQFHVKIRDGYDFLKKLKQEIKIARRTLKLLKEYYFFQEEAEQIVHRVEINGRVDTWTYSST